MCIRTLGARDADDFVDLLAVLDIETDYLMFEPGERPVDRAGLGRRLADHDPEHGVLFALVDPPLDIVQVEDDDLPLPLPLPGPGLRPRRAGERLAGFVGARRRAGSRNRHSLHLVIALRQSHVGRGHGRRLLGAVEQFAREHGVTRLELTVMVENERAIGLYESAGFEREGLHRRAIRLQDGWRDEFSYAKLLESRESATSGTGSETP